LIILQGYFCQFIKWLYFSLSYFSSHSIIIPNNHSNPLYFSHISLFSHSLLPISLFTNSSPNQAKAKSVFLVAKEWNYVPVLTTVICTYKTCASTSSKVQTYATFFWPNYTLFWVLHLFLRSKTLNIDLFKHNVTL
jgi:hypothetical protein